MGAKQPKYLCSICKFNSDGHCVADESTDWCPKLLLPELSSTRLAMEWWRNRCRETKAFLNEAVKTSLRQSRNFAALRKREKVAEYDLAAMRQRAKRAEEALRQIKCAARSLERGDMSLDYTLKLITRSCDMEIGNNDGHPTPIGSLLGCVGLPAGTLDGDHPGEFTEMVGERELAPYIPEPWGGPEGDE